MSPQHAMGQLLEVNCLKDIVLKVLIASCVYIKDSDGVSLHQNTIQHLSHLGTVLFYCV